MKKLLMRFAACLTACALGVAAISCGDDPNGSTPDTPPTPDTPTPDTGKVSIELDAKYASAIYVGGSQGLYAYLLLLSEAKPVIEFAANGNPSISATGPGQAMLVELYSSTGSETSIPAGDYKAHYNAQQQPTPPAFYGAGNTQFITFNEAGEVTSPTKLKAVAGSSVVITDEANGQTAVMNCTLIDNRTVRCSFSGTVEVIPAPAPVYSTLTSDVTVDLAGKSAAAAYFGDNYQVGADVYSIEIGDFSKPGRDLMMFELLAPVQGYTGELPTGTFTVLTAADEEKKDYTNKLLPGAIIEQNGQALIASSWYLAEMTAQGVTGLAPIAGGKLTISKEESGYKLVLDALDDHETPFKISATWTGNITVQDGTQQQQAPAHVASKSGVQRRPLVSFAR